MMRSDESASDDVIEQLRASLAGQYVIGAEIGRGASAVVFGARDTKHDRAVAIKVLRPDVAIALGSDRFLREIRVVARLSHPHIVALFDSAETDGLLYYIMPLVEGGE